MAFTIYDLIFPLTPLVGQLNGNQKGGAYTPFSYVINLLLMVLAGYLAWNCNALESQPIRILYTVLAALFSGLYLLYYLVWHILLNNRC